MAPKAASLRYADLVLGQQAAFEARLDGCDIDAFSQLSGDASPLHLDDGFAARRGYAQRVAHGAHLVALASQLAGMHLPGRNCLLLGVAMSFVAPVLAGTAVTVTGTVDQLSEATQAAVLKVTVQESTTGRLLARGRLTLGFTRDVADA